ncbi:NmrA-like family protein [Nitrosospira sp. Nsp2]|uniref:NmrA family NAD(P)-binding protein n=1 Tax=Nitrosospira sp. Nsp2 TaxID=136548 RepID=UPI000D47BB0E|nr:NmrA family NAD(P)-binding protein [Nitrosospira sp. Nsp2]PTR15819.1 NmrA-like family protein [Nitrosospira sp. Nsp2]
MKNDRTILITGVTGNQGGAVARALQGAGVHLRGPDAKAGQPAAAALSRQDIEIVKGDLDDEATLRHALAGAWGVFGMQNAGEAGVEREEAQGKRLATLLREAGIEHFVYTSVGSADKQTGVPHFDSKWRIEETVRGLRFPSHVILRPVFFMENLLAP